MVSLVAVAQDVGDLVTGHGHGSSKFGEKTGLDQTLEH